MNRISSEDKVGRLGLMSHELQSLAQEGLYYSEGQVHEERRYRRILELAAELVTVGDLSKSEAKALQWLSDPPSLTPYPVADAAVLDESGRLLLIRREDDGLWAMPGGACHVGETPAEVATRELQEETGIRSTPVTLVGVYDSRLCGTRSRSHLYHFVFRCEPVPEDKPARPKGGSGTAL